MLCAISKFYCFDVLIQSYNKDNLIKYLKKSLIFIRFINVQTIRSTLRRIITINQSDFFVFLKFNQLKNETLIFNIVNLQCCDDNIVSWKSSTCKLIFYFIQILFWNIIILFLDWTWKRLQEKTLRNWTFTVITIQWCWMEFWTIRMNLDSELTLWIFTQSRQIVRNTNQLRSKLHLLIQIVMRIHTE